MRGRTNISGGGGFIDGQLEKYEIADGKTVTKGQFVEFEIEAEVKKISSTTFLRPSQRISLGNKRYLVFYNTSNSVRTLYLISFERKELEFLSAYPVNCEYGNIIEYNGKFYTFDNNLNSLLEFVINENNIELNNSYVFEEITNVVGISLSESKIILISENNSIVGIPYSVIELSSESPTFLLTSSILTDLRTSDAYVFPKTVNNRIYAQLTYYRSYNYPRIYSFYFDNETNELSDIKIVTSLNDEIRGNIFSGIDDKINENFIFYIEPYGDSRALTTYKIVNKAMQISQTLFSGIDDYSGAYDGLFVGEEKSLYIYRNMIYLMNFNSITGSFEILKTLRNKMSTISSIIFFENNIFHIIFCNVGTSTGVNYLKIELTENNDISFMGSKKIKPYESIINGVANQSGTEGDTIEIYVPTTE